MSFLGDINERLNNTEPQSFELIPAGWYQATIKKADLVPTKDGTGQRLNLQFCINGPTYAGRMVFTGLNLRNKNKQAEEIATQQLRSIRDTLGITNLTDSDQLIGGTLMIKVKEVPEDGQYEAKNDVSAYKAINGEAPKQEAPAKSNTPPWLNRKEEEGMY